MFGSDITNSWIFWVVPKLIGMFHFFLCVSSTFLHQLLWITFVGHLQAVSLFDWQHWDCNTWYLCLETVFQFFFPSLIKGQEQPTHYQQSLTIWLYGRWVESMNKICAILFCFERQREEHHSSVENWNVWYMSTPWLGLQNRIYFSTRNTEGCNIPLSASWQHYREK